MKNKLMLLLLSIMLIFQLALSSLPGMALAQDQDRNDASGDVMTNDTVMVDEEAVNHRTVDSTKQESIKPQSKDEDVSGDIATKEPSSELVIPLKNEEKEAVEKKEVSVKKPQIASKEIIKEAVVSKKLSTKAAIETKIIQTITYTDKKGNIINQGAEMAMGDEITLKADWALPEPHSYVAGDTYSFKLPTQLLIASEQQGNLQDTSGVIFGTYTISKTGDVVFTFNDEIEKQSIIKGTFEVQSSLKEKLSGNPNQELVVDVPGAEDWITGIIVKPNVVESLTKTGILDKAKNPSKVTWTIDFNKKLEKIGDVTITDPVPVGLRFISGSMKVYELNVDLNGTATQGAQITENYTKFPLTMKNVTKAYRIVYETKIIDKVNATYKNKVTLTANGKTINAEASVTTSYLEAMDKKVGAYDPSTHLLNWTVKFNQKEDALTKAQSSFIDYYDGQKLDVQTKSFIVKELSYDAAGKEVWTSVPASEYTVTRTSSGMPAGKTGFKFEFKKAVNKTYLIDYQTFINPETVLNTSVANTVSGLGGEWTANKTVPNSFLIKVKGKENYEDKTIAWNVTINYDKKILSNVRITETYPNGGLLLRPSTVVIKNSADVALVVGTDYTLTDNKENGFDITFLKDVTDKLTISYVTDYDTTKTINGKNTFKNKATVTETINGTDYKADGEATFTPGTESQNNGFKSGDYDYSKKVFKWTLGINYNQESIAQLVVTDSSPQDLITDLNSFKIVKLDLTAGGVGVEAGEFTNFTVVAEQINGHAGFRLIFNEAISSAYKITYEAKDEDEIIIKEYTNNATVTGPKTPSKLTAKIPVLHGDEYAIKHGKQDGDVINWSVDFNFAQSSLTHASLIDKPSDNQFILQESFHVYFAEPSSTKKGEFVKGDELSPTLYDILMNDDGSFRLKFKQDIHEGYFIEYQSYINAPTGAIIENKVYAQSDQAGTETNPSSEKITVVLTNSGGTASGETGAVTIKKVDAITPDKVLKDAVFTIWNVDSDGNKRFALKTLKTNDAGEVTFDQLLYKDYIIVEDKAPDGYKVNVNAQSTVTVNQDSQELTVKNMPLNTAGQLAIKKVDAKDATKLLAGAEFKLMNIGNKVVIDKIVTDEEGTALVDVPLVIE
ncbi:collagen binding domain-containing protein [Kurthia sibirica]|uniref:Uncharacterized protein n=1 Tax=Kurthia sibirica TaxID=202750 RepID=A0A2U3AMG1_9BACL|nr:collagen binding domain-containing protein [Kurthia sibirica]PWI25717.1 hypothetical protein DEX24_07350 [Kurthia sibirica]GEK33725.1 hypothetical protein KSI01_12580 [Kurthia sibirica]